VRRTAVSFIVPSGRTGLIKQLAAESGWQTMGTTQVGARDEE
jgi:hypothetical protein